MMERKPLEIPQEKHDWVAPTITTTGSLLKDRPNVEDGKCSDFGGADLALSLGKGGVQGEEIEIDSDDEGPNEDDGGFGNYDDSSWDSDFENVNVVMDTEVGKQLIDKTNDMDMDMWSNIGERSDYCSNSDDNAHFQEEDLDEPRLLIGMEFPSGVELRRTVEEFAIKNGFDLKRKKNEAHRYTVECAASGCRWRLHASVLKDKHTFCIKTLRAEHTCVRVERNRTANAKWIATKIEEKVREDRDLKLKTIQNDMWRVYNVFVSMQSVYRAKRKALAKIDGCIDAQYHKLRNYCTALYQTNPGTRALISVERPLPYSLLTFKRLFVCFDACKKGFLVGCRPLIGLDGCHLSGPKKGILLAAVGQDGNNGLYPIAFAVVESENANSWTWFLQQLLMSIGPVEEHGWTFMSDRQKGLLSAFDELIPAADHRFCCRHLYENFKKKHPGRALRGTFWLAARSCNRAEFDLHMATIKKIKPTAYGFLESIPSSSWSRHAFSPRVKNVALVNNFSESFNNMILQARERPIINLAETIRRMCMKTIGQRANKNFGERAIICPNIVKKLKLVMGDARMVNLIPSGDGYFECRQLDKIYVVSLKDKTCSCREWLLSGLPCKHAMAAIMFDRKNMEEFCDEAFSVARYKKTYDYVIHPIVDESEWPEAEGNIVHPPIVRNQTGRPRKARRKEKDEKRRNDDVPRPHGRALNEEI